MAGERKSRVLCQGGVTGSKDHKMKVVQSSMARHSRDPFVKSSISVSALINPRAQENGECSDLFVVVALDWSLCVERVPLAKKIQNSVGLSLPSCCFVVVGNHV